MQINNTDKVSQKANDIINHGNVDSFLNDLNKKIPDSANKSGIIERWSTIIKYLKDSNVPKSEKAKILAMLIYIVSPIDLLPGPLDDLVVFGVMLKKIDSELEKFVRGEYKESANKEKKESFENPFMDLS